MWSSALRLAVFFLNTIPSISAQSYILADDYEPSTFFDKFNFYTGNDPTNGYVQYVNQSYAKENGLIGTYSDHVTVGVDTTNIYNANGPGRPSIRLESKNTYNHSLYILSLSHMPYGCGTWPAFWSLGPNWPSHGEIDVIEGVNSNTNNLMSLHTSDNCTMAGANETGILETNNCYINANDNSGCGVQSASTTSYGSGFNNAGGGVYAMEWTSNWIRIWFFKRNAVPGSITAGLPDPSTFGTPSANFQGSCNIDSHFGEHTIVLDVTFCGEYAGNTYGSTSCPMTSGQSGYQSCTSYVAQNPSAFTEAYWSISSLKIYELADTSASASSSIISTSLSSVTPVAATASLSSINVAMGANSSSTSIGSSSLFVPSATSSINGTSSRSIYSGPNSLTGDTSSSAAAGTSPFSSSSTTTALPIASGAPKCHSIFENADGNVYRIYCNATISGENLIAVTASNFTECISICDTYNNTCSGSVFTNTSIPASCSLKTSSSSRKAKRVMPVVAQTGAFAALRLASASSPSPNDPSASSGSVSGTIVSRGSTIRTTASNSSGSGKMTSIVSVSTVIVGTVTTTATCSNCSTSLGFTSGGTSYTISVSLCYTCTLTPILVTITAPDTSQASYTSISSTEQTTVAPHAGQVPSLGIAASHSQTSALGISLPPSISTSQHPATTQSATDRLVASDQTVPGTCTAKFTTTTWIESTLTMCPTPLTCPQSTGLPSGSSDSALPNCPNEPDGRVYIDSMGMKYALHCSTMLSGPNIDRQTQLNLRNCIASCDTWNYMHFYPWGPSGCAGVSFFADGASPNCLLKAYGASLVKQSGVDSGILLTNIAGGGVFNGTGSMGQGTTSIGSMTLAGPSGTAFSGTAFSFSRTAFSGTASSGPALTGHASSAPAFSGPASQGTAFSGHASSEPATSGTASQTTASSGPASPGTVFSGTPLPATAFSTPPAGPINASPSYGYSTIISNGNTVISTYGISTLISNGVTVLSTYGVRTATVTTTTTTLSNTVSVSISYIYATQTVTQHDGGGGGGSGSSSSSSSRTCRTAATHYAKAKNRRGSVLYRAQPREILDVSDLMPMPMPAARLRPW